MILTDFVTVGPDPPTRRRAASVHSYMRVTLRNAVRHEQSPGLNGPSARVYQEGPNDHPGTAFAVRVRLGAVTALFKHIRSEVGAHGA